MLLYTMLYIVLAYLMLFAALTNSVCLNNASFFFLFKYFLCQGYELSGEIALKNNHYYYYYYVRYEICGILTKYQIIIIMVIFKCTQPFHKKQRQHNITKIDRLKALCMMHERILNKQTVSITQDKA